MQGGGDIQDSNIYEPPQGATIQEGRHSGLDTHGGRQLAEGNAGRKGIFPKTYVMVSECVCVCMCLTCTVYINLQFGISFVLQVLTREEARQILIARDDDNEKQARALYDFEGERKNLQ